MSGSARDDDDDDDVRGTRTHEEKHYVGLNNWLEQWVTFQEQQSVSLPKPEVFGHLGSSTHTVSFPPLISGKPPCF